MEKCIVMLSGGLDSRLAVKIMQEQGLEVIALYFNLPFGTGCCSERCSFNFSQMSGVKMKLFDCSKGELLQEYLEVIRKHSHGTGSGVNPCLDCRIFMFKKAKEYADKEGIKLVASGEVLGERPMSQHRKALDVVEEESGLKGRLLRPLSAKLLPETEAEKKGIVDRSKLYDIEGRRREKQIELAKKFNISFPHPAGGCLLCEKGLIKRMKFLLKRGLNEKEIKLVVFGRHFIIDDCWVILGKDRKENDFIESLDFGEIVKAEDLDVIGPSALILDKCDKDKVNKLIIAYSKGHSLEERKEFEEYVF
jgi:tRNA-specific 2-thiouridylase